MRDPALPLKRLRLELDQTLRGRAFISRAIRGALTWSEHLDLVVQLRALVRVAGDEELRHLADLELAGDATPDPCVAATIFSRVIQSASLSASDVRPSVLTVLGTSWIPDLLTSRDHQVNDAVATGASATS